MHVEEYGWHSPRVGRWMGIRVYGHYGSPIVVFPTSGGDEREYEGQGMIDALGHHIEAGKVKLFCVNSVNNESLVQHAGPPAAPQLRCRRCTTPTSPTRWRLSSHDHCGTPGIGITTTGASFGAYHAANTLLKHPFALPALPGPVGRLRHPEVHGRGLRRQLLLQQPRRLRGQLERPLLPPPARPGRHPPGDRERSLGGLRPHLPIVGGPALARDPSRGRRLGADGGHDWPYWKRQMDEYLWRLY